MITTFVRNAVKRIVLTASPSMLDECAKFCITVIDKAGSVTPCFLPHADCSNCPFGKANTGVTCGSGDNQVYLEIAEYFLSEIKHQVEINNAGACETLDMDVTEDPGNIIKPRNRTKPTEFEDSVAHYLSEVGELLVKKNADYGNSAEKSYYEFGDVAYFIRLGDKINRLRSLTIDNKKAEVKDESITDTLTDIIGYTILYKLWRGKNNGDR